MSTYIVKVPFSGVMEFEVEADCKKEAIDIVLEADFEIGDVSTDSDEIESGEIADWDLHENIKEVELCCGLKKITAKKDE